jgi:hypothetical protein
MFMKLAATALASARSKTPRTPNGQITPLTGSKPKGGCNDGIMLHRTIGFVFFGAPQRRLPVGHYWLITTRSLEFEAWDFPFLSVLQG